jgi:hypothetical protein
MSKSFTALLVNPASIHYFWAGLDLQPRGLVYAQSFKFILPVSLFYPVYCSAGNMHGADHEQPERTEHCDL